MGFPKQIKDIVYQLLQEPTLDNFRAFMKGQTGEHNSIDFKEVWPEKGKLAKIMLGIANSGGGIIVMGVHENEDNSFECCGLEKLREKTTIAHDINKYISSELRYEIYDFSYNSSEYEELRGKNFQLLYIEDSPEHLPFVSLKEGEDIKENTIYVRRGTATEAANDIEIQDIINRRINYEYPNNGQPLELSDHMEQLEELYRHIDKTKREYDYTGLGFLKDVKSLFGKYTEFENPYYPEESYDEFVARIIQMKKKKIERLLDLK